MQRKGFLQLVAEDMQQVFNGKYDDVTVLFPNKRAQLFMNDLLMAQHGEGPMWTPHYMTISELFEELTDVMVADPLFLICRLYQVYQKVTKTNETLDHFYSWGELMLSDFEDVDNNMTDAKALFANISDLQDLTSFDYLSAEQKKALEQFFGNFSPEKHSYLQGEFTNIWNALYPIYTQFRESLLAEKKAYGGMMKRLVAEALKNDDGTLSAKLGTRNFIVVGFNVLNSTEKAMFNFLKEERNTLFYWDYDQGYADTEAGMFIKENMLQFPNRFAGRDFYNNLKTDTEKKISIISSPTEDAQSRYITKWLKQKDITTDNHTAIVLCNEKILNSVLHSIPASIDGKDLELNITMGYPLNEMPVFGLVNVLMDLQAHGRTSGNSWRYSVVSRVLRHPYITRMSNGASTDLLERIKQRNMMFPPDSMFHDNPVIEKIFTPCKSVKEITAYLSGIVEEASLFESDSALFVESIYHTFKTINRIGTVIESTPGFDINLDTYGRLLNQHLKGLSIPFHGEPAIGLQVMGFLETRNLDFDNIILLSASEGQMPRVTQNNSFIPYTLRVAYGMTTLEKKISIYAYYYYRLLQRARNITLMYCDGESVLSKGEMSRFILQTLIEHKKLFAPNIRIEQLALSSESKVDKMIETGVCGSEEATMRIRHLYDLAFEQEFKESHNGREMLLSPSVLNTYIDCKRKFFLKYIAGLSKDEEVSEEVDNAMFGTIFHYCMEQIYKPLKGRQVQSSYLLNLARDNKAIESIVNESFAINFFQQPKGQKFYAPEYNGDNLLNKHVVTRYVKKQLKSDAERCPFTILGVECKRYSTLEIPCDWGTLKVRIGGIIDRMEKVSDAVENPGSSQERIRIVDYKTNNKAQSTRNLENLFDGNKANRAYNVLQALYYCSIVSEKESLPVFPELIYVKPEVRGAVKIGKDPVLDFSAEYKKEYDSRLTELLQTMFSPKTDFEKTKLTAHCQYCDFCKLCNRDAQ